MTNITISAQVFEDMADRIEELEAKLAKVITAYRIEAMRRDDYSHAAFQQHLAELIRGQKDA